MRRTSRSGFTLIEVLLAAAMAGVIGLAVASTFRAAQDAERTVRGRAERRGAERIALARIARDLRGLVPAGGIYASGIVGTQGAAATGGDALASEAEIAAANARALEEHTDAPPATARDTMTLAVLPSPRRFGAPLDPGTGAIEQVVWAVDDDPATPERGLVRRATRVRDPLPGSDPEPAEVAGEDVVGLRLRYWDGETWADTWDSGASDTLPRAVEVTLAFLDSGGTIRSVQTLVAPPTARPSDSALPAQGSGQ